MTGLSLFLGGCASVGPPLPPSLELPKPPPDLRAKRKGDKVTLTWTIPARTTDRQSVRYLGKTRVCRGVEAALTQCGNPVGEAAPPADFARRKDTDRKKLSATYTDTLPLNLRLSGAFGSATYAVEVLNRDGRSAGLSNQVHVPLTDTLPPPTDFAAHVTAKGVVLTWTGQLLAFTLPSLVHYKYRVYRRDEAGKQEVPVGEADAGMESHLTLTDQNFEWEKTYYYHADTFSTISQPGKPEIQVEGDDTPEVRVFTDDIFPPAVPGGLQAVFSGPGQQAFIDLIWSPVSDADLAGYNMYRREEGGTAVKINSELVKTPAYRDMKIASGKTYFYSVSAVDLRGNESGHSEEASESLP